MKPMGRTRRSTSHRTAAIYRWHIGIASLMVAALAQVGAAVGQQGGSLPLSDVMKVGERYPNLILEIRLQLVRAGLKRDAVICSADRLDNTWTHLGGSRIAPYNCSIGRRQLVVQAETVYHDGSGRRLDPARPETRARAQTISERRLKWRWR